MGSGERQQSGVRVSLLQVQRGSGPRQPMGARAQGDERHHEGQGIGQAVLPQVQDR